MSTVMLASVPNGIEPPTNTSQGNQTSRCVPHFPPDLGRLQAGQGRAGPACLPSGCRDPIPVSDPGLGLAQGPRASAGKS